MTDSQVSIPVPSSQVSIPVPSSRISRYRYVIWGIVGVLLVAGIITAVVLLTRKKKCVPNCPPNYCGSDDCGGICGCPSGYICTNNRCASCVPSCIGKQCGSDNCNGSCGTCPSGEICVNGQCVAGCTPNCTDKQCGPDGCNGSCGTCPSGDTCINGQCVPPGCVPNCAGKHCGADGCGGLCGGGTGPGGCLNSCYVCANGLCSPSPPNCGTQQCGTDSCNNSCGICPTGQVCSTTGQCIHLSSGDYYIKYTEPNASSSSCLYVTDYPVQGSGSLSMQPTNPDGTCPKPVAITNPNGSVTFPQDLRWRYNNNDLTWHTDIGKFQICLDGNCINMPYSDQPACMYCANNKDPKTCNQLNCGASDFCNGGYYNGQNLNYVQYAFEPDGSLRATFACPDGSACPAGSQCLGVDCRYGGVLLAPCSPSDPKAPCPPTIQTGRPVITDPTNQRAYGWSLSPYAN